MSALDDEKSYTRWINSKAAKLSRETLDCGCPTVAGEETGGHIWCNRLSCLEHVDDPHDCSEYAGVKSSTEEEAPEPAEAAPPAPVVPLPTSSWVSFADVAAGPVAGADSAVDVRRRVQDGTAPTPAASQGLTECEIDGVRWIYGGGRWSESPYQPEPVSPHIDELEEPTYRRYECPHPGCEWVKVTLDLDVFDGLLAEHERTAHAPTRNPISDLYAALRARATRRGGTT